MILFLLLLILMLVLGKVLPYCYNSKLLELDYEVTLYLVTQENSIENSVQDLSTLYMKSAWSVLSLSSLP